MSVAGGTYRAVIRGHDVGCQTIALFSASPRVWRRPIIQNDDIELYQDQIAKTGIHPVIMHALYLVNLASTDPVLLDRSISTMLKELQFAETFGIPWIVLHPGSHKGNGLEAGIKCIARSLDTILQESGTANVKIALETTSGSSHSIGGRFEHLRDIMGSTKSVDRLGVCVDTCHVFVSGYDIRTLESWHKTKSDLSKCLSLDKLAVIHLNDSKKELGSSLDRHDQIGKGHIGVEGFRAIVNDPDLQRLPMILETPKDKNGLWDRENLKLLRSLLPN